MIISTDDHVINIPLGEFALPVPRIGSIEAHSGYGRSTLEGQEIHQRVQRKRGKADPLYQAEVPISTVFSKGGFRFRISGRLDGIFRHELPVIEEIKSAFNLHDLRRRLAADPFQHPYSLQLLSYGYFHWLEHGVVPRLTFHLVSSRNGRSHDLELILDRERYAEWLELRLDELVLEAAEAKKRAQRRRKMAGQFEFPFQTPRPGQVELMREVEQGMAMGCPQLIQAPTGLGKTVGVLHPVLREALSRGQQVVYVTPKNSQHAVAEDAAERFRQSGAPLRSLTVTAKGKICLKEEALCTPEYCEYARDYYGKLARHGVIALLSKKRKLKARHFRELGEQFEVCPFELQIDSAKLAELVVCDYNYVFAPRSALGRAGALAVEEVGKPNLVIDEAHNLPARAMEYYSPMLSAAALEGMREELRGVPAPFAREAEELLDDSLKVVAACQSGKSPRPTRIELPLDPFLEQDGRLRAFLSRYLESEVEIGQQDPVLRFAYYWSEFTDVLALAAASRKQEFFTTFHPQQAGRRRSSPPPSRLGNEGPGGSVKITCCDASAMLAGSYADYQQVVGFSATLKPFDYYARLSGLDPAAVQTAEFPSPFPRQRRKLLIIPQISTRYSHRERNYGKIAEALRRIVALRRGNYLAFFPSFDFMERVAELFEAPEGYRVLGQEKNMRQSRGEEILERLRGAEEPTVLFAVQGGSFSEGIDYAGEMAIGAFVVGPPLPTFDLEREEMRGYYQRHYGAGFEYAYVIPAMAKAIQAAGRVIRSESDRGVVVLMDSRFLEPGYSGSMPADWFEEEAKELVSEAILKDVAEFWQASDLSPLPEGEG
ncbi:ATP-dependent DNA helicase [Geomonas sp.]|uniref:ATP-dependent DNA helicase n=1 Tax=Geomonas sp. TaxID=2651584 RepID=UPI002B48B9EF|nr:ATP-dependent DNA helicase [Geomonas sp.]HJV36460.1 ATP-dependent DNA helicase [Geomonas sp.]